MGTFDAPIEENGGPDKRALVCSAHETGGHSNSAACRLLGIHRNTGQRWLQGRDGVGGLVRQGLDPQTPRASSFGWRVPAAYLSEDERIFIADRLLTG